MNNPLCHDHLALDKDPGLGYNILLLRLIKGDFQSANRQFHGRFVLPISYPNACVPSRGLVVYTILIWPYIRPILFTLFTQRILDNDTAKKASSYHCHRWQGGVVYYCDIIGSL